MACLIYTKSDESDKKLMLHVSEGVVIYLRKEAEKFIGQLLVMSCSKENIANSPFNVTWNTYCASASLTMTSVLPMLCADDEKRMQAIARRDAFLKVSTRTAGCGFINTSSNCYVNSVMQAIFHVPALGEVFLEHLRNSSCCSFEQRQVCLNCMLAKTWIISKRAPRPLSLRPLFNETKKENSLSVLSFTRQEDAHEFFIHLMDAVENVYRKRNGGKLPSEMPIVDLFAGQLTMIVKCRLCGYVSERNEDFRNILLQILETDATIENSFEQFFEIEAIDEHVYDCDGCEQKVPFTKGYRLKEAPKILCVQIQRFDFSGAKIHEEIECGLALNLNRFRSQQAIVDAKQDFDYKLISIVNHFGRNVNYGHYRAFTRVNGNEFFDYNDCCISEINTENFTDCASQGYLLFYELNETSVHESLTTAGKVDSFELIKADEPIEPAAYEFLPILVVPPTTGSRQVAVALPSFEERPSKDGAKIKKRKPKISKAVRRRLIRNRRY